MSSATVPGSCMPLTSTVYRLASFAVGTIVTGALACAVPDTSSLSPQLAVLKPVTGAENCTVNGSESAEELSAPCVTATVSSGTAKTSIFAQPSAKAQMKNVPNVTSRPLPEIELAKLSWCVELSLAAPAATSKLTVPVAFIPETATRYTVVETAEISAARGFEGPDSNSAVDAQQPETGALNVSWNWTGAANCNGVEETCTEGCPAKSASISPLTADVQITGRVRSVQQSECCNYASPEHRNPPAETHLGVEENRLRICANLRADLVMRCAGTDRAAKTEPPRALVEKSPKLRKIRFHLEII